MARRWPKDLVWTEVILEVESASCGECGRRMHVCDYRHHRIYTLEGPRYLVCKLVHCPDAACPNHHHTFGPERELTLTMPWWLIGWDVFCWLGHRRFARHWSVPQLRAELLDRYGIPLSEDAIEDYLQRYQCMVAARQQDPVQLKKEYQKTRHVMLSIDGLQPEKGHETLYVVRELGQQRVWFAEALLSSATSEIRPLIVKARAWAERLERPVRLWMSDKQDAFVTTIAEEFPGKPHRYCGNHFLRDLAKPMLELDSRAKVQMRSKIRGLRAIEREVLTWRAAERAEQDQEQERLPAVLVSATNGWEVVLDYWAAVRGILNDSQGGPLRPPGLRMSQALAEVEQSLQRNVRLKKGGQQKPCWNAWRVASTKEEAWSWKRRNKWRCMSRRFAMSTRPWTPFRIAGRYESGSMRRSGAACWTKKTPSGNKWAE
jgi:hypothetical protein